MNYHNDTRSKCIREIIALVGEGGMQAFLRQRQPALGDRTGAELLQREPEELLDRLEMLRMDHESLGTARPPGRRKSKEQDRVLAILDELERRAG